MMVGSQNSLILREKCSTVHWPLENKPTICYKEIIESHGKKSSFGPRNYANRGPNYTDHL